MTVTDHVRRAGLTLGLTALLAGGGLTMLGPVAAQAASMAPPAGPAAAATWSVQRTPPIPDPSGGLSGISCTSASFCVAVGNPVAVWNGTSWQPQQLPGNLAPSAVSCASPAFCVVVGETNGNTEIVAWNGSTWAVQSSPSLLGELNAVSCSSASACLAVGETYTETGSPRPLAEQWNGTQWTQLPNPWAKRYGQLGAVSCSSPSACTAIGQSRNKSRIYSTLIERWNGSSLALQQSAAPASYGASATTGVSCPQNRGCIAVRSSSSESPFFERWNGSSWTAMTSPALSDSLNSLSCAAITACTAVGAGTASGSAVAEQLTGTTWSAEHVPTPAGSSGSSLTGVSCPLAADCMAVGGDDSRARDDVSLAEQWTGTRWSILAAPNGSRVPLGSFTGISCSSSSACTAVGGFASSDGSDVPLGETWNGTRWTVHNPPATSSGVIQPAAVSCPAASTCVAVGSSGGNPSPWAAVRNGNTWVSYQPPPPSGVTWAELTGVSCVSATYCIAIGVSFIDESAFPLAYSWNGTTWTMMTMPAGGGYLSAVSCTSQTWCVAVGLSLAEEWNGTAWTIMPASGFPDTNAVSCSSAMACTAVGSVHVTGGQQAAAERWDGTSWTAQQPALAPPGYKFAQLNGVSCASVTACTAVGYYWNGRADNTTKPFIQAWDGTGWTAEQAPATGYSDLNAVSCNSPAVCTAAGVMNTTSAKERPLAERSG